MGRLVTIRAEVRKPPKGGFLRFAVGRVDPDSPIGLGRHVFFDDLPHLIEAAISIYETTLPRYTDMEMKRIEDQRRLGIKNLKDRIKEGKTEEWRRQLLEIAERQSDFSDASEKSDCKDSE